MLPELALKDSQKNLKKNLKKMLKELPKVLISTLRIQMIPVSEKSRWIDEIAFEQLCKDLKESPTRSHNILYSP